jgi:hypothetical protein
MRQPAALAQAQSIPLATDGLSDASVPASVPKWNLILPQNNIAQLGTGKEVRVDFNIQCQDIGKIQNMLINFQYTTEVGKTPTLIPTPYWANRIDFIAPNGDTYETLYPDLLFSETCSLLTDQTVNTVAPLYNFKVTPGATTSSATVDFADPVDASGGSYSHWLSLNASFLAACQPYLRGCGTGFFKISLYMNGNLSVDGLAASQGVLTCNAMNLWVQEAVLSKNAEDALAMAHQSGIQYASCVRNQYSLTLGSAVSAGQSTTLQLQGFFAESAGLYLLFKPSSSNVDTLTRIPVSSMYLQDSQGRQLTQNMTAELIEAIVSPSVVPVSSYFVNSPYQTTYIFPFSTNIVRVLEGKMLGSYQLTGNERLVVTAKGTIPSASQFVATSWDYAKLVVTNNQPRQYVLGSNA